MVIKKNLALFVMISATLVGNNLQATAKVKTIFDVFTTLGSAFVVAGTCKTITEEMKKQHVQQQWIDQQKLKTRLSFHRLCEAWNKR